MKYNSKFIPSCERYGFLNEREYSFSIPYSGKSFRQALNETQYSRSHYLTSNVKYLIQTKRRIYDTYLCILLRLSSVNILFVTPKIRRKGDESHAWNVQCRGHTSSQHGPSKTKSPMTGISVPNQYSTNSTQERWLPQSYFLPSIPEVVTKDPHVSELAW